MTVISLATLLWKHAVFLVIAAEPWNPWNPIPGGPITAKLISATRSPNWSPEDSVRVFSFIWVSEKTKQYYDMMYIPKQTPGFLSSQSSSIYLPNDVFVPFAHCAQCTVPLLTILFNLSYCNISPPNFHHAFQTIKLFKRIRIWQDSVNVKYAPQGFIHLSKHTSIRSAFKRSPTFTFISLHV